MCQETNATTLVATTSSCAALSQTPFKGFLHILSATKPLAPSKDSLLYETLCSLCSAGFLTLVKKKSLTTDDRNRQEGTGVTKRLALKEDMLLRCKAHKDEHKQVLYDGLALCVVITIVLFTYSLLRLTSTLMQTTCMAAVYRYIQKGRDANLDIVWRIVLIIPQERINELQQ